MRPTKVVVVALFGFFGALLRFVISELGGTVGGFPIATFLINIIGCFVLGWFYTLSVRQVTVHPLLRLGIGTGFLGAVTTFSTFVIETWKMMDAGLYGFAELYVLITVVVGIAATWFGSSVGKWQSTVRIYSQTRSR